MRGTRLRAGGAIVAFSMILLPAGCANLESAPMLSSVLEAMTRASDGKLDESTIVAGLKEALRVGTGNAVSITSVKNGFLRNDLIRIPLPDAMEPMADALRAIGLGAKVEEVEVAMNRAAERASGEALDLFIGAVQNMTFADAREILAGGEAAATDYFRRTTEDALRARFEPVAEHKMGEVGLVRLYGELAARYAALPFVTTPAPEIGTYVTQKGLDGLFTILASEARKIREDPAARTTELLVQVFGR
jgi:hypothetical protein